MAGVGRRNGFDRGVAACLLLALAAPSACASGADSGGRGPERAPAAASPAAAPPAASGTSAPALAIEGGARVVARVDGEPVYAHDAFRLVFLSAPDEAANAVRRLVVDRLCAGEAAAIGAGVPPAVVERELPRMLGDQERKVREASKGRSDLAAYVKSTFGFELATYQALVRASLERSLLLERVVLYELSRHPRVQLRMIRVKEKALAQEIRGKLALGADFAVLARQHSEDGSAREGGVYPPLPSDLPSPLFEKTGELAAGAVSEVDEVSTADGPRFRIVQVLARLSAETGSYAERAAAIEQVLDGRPLAPLELDAWMRIMEERHQIRLLGMGTDDERP